MEEKTHYSDTDFKVRLIAEADREMLANFLCGVDELDDFFHYEIYNCVEHHYLSAYCLVLASGEIIGIFTLMNDALMLTGLCEKEDFIDDLKYETHLDTVEFLNSQSSYPAINIGHLGISRKYQNKSIGTMVIDFVAQTFADYKKAGCQFITVDALNNLSTIKFYHNNLFNFQTNKDFYSSTRRMYRIL